MVPLLFKEGWFAQQTGVVTAVGVAVSVIPPEAGLWFICNLQTWHNASVGASPQINASNVYNHPVLLRKPPLLEKEGNSNTEPGFLANSSFEEGTFYIAVKKTVIVKHWLLAD